MSKAFRNPWFGHLAQRVVCEVLIHIALTTTAGTILFLVVDFIEVGNRARDAATAADIAELSLLSIPHVLKLILPMSAPIGTLTAIGAQVRRREVAAAMSAGASPLAFLKPLLIAGVLVGVFYSAVVEFLVPAAIGNLNVVRHRIGLPTHRTYWTQQNWFKGDERLYRVRGLGRTDGSVLLGVLILHVDAGRLVDRWDVEALSFEDGRWVGRRVIHRNLGDDLTTHRYANLPLEIPERPDDFVTGIGRPEKMRYHNLGESVRRRLRLGRPAVTHRLELFRRHSVPAAVVMMIALAGALGLRLNQNRSVAAALALGTTLGFCGWLLQELAQLFGTAGAVDPRVAGHVLPAVLVPLLIGAWFRVWSVGLSE